MLEAVLSVILVMIVSGHDSNSTISGVGKSEIIIVSCDGQNRMHTSMSD